jgi:antitoxin Phd
LSAIKQGGSVYKNEPPLLFMVIALNRLILSYYLCIINIYGGDSMKINTKNIVSITEANQNFSKVARLVDEKGLAVILKNNVPRYLVLEFNSVEDEQNAEDEDVIEISKRLMKKNKQAYEVLAK